MKKNLFLFVAVAMLLVFHAVAADKVNVTGTWEITTQSPRGERTHDIEFVQDGEKLKVKMDGRRGMIEAEGTVKGDKIEWTISRETPRGNFTMTYKGTVKGDEIKGTMETPRGDREWTAKRKKETK